MRLAQLARKLARRPSEIIDFLNSQNIHVAEGANARLEDGVVELVLLKYAPVPLEEEIELTKKEKDTEITARPPEESDADFPNPGLVEFERDPIPAPASDKAEIIKAPKAELAGLKVLGKIELPQPKKNTEGNPVNDAAAAPSASDDQLKKPAQEQRRTVPGKRSEQRPRKNPIALAREKEELEARRKRDAAAETAKEQRTKNYFKRVKVSAPTKRARLIDEPAEEMPVIDGSPLPKTWFGKVARWFRT